VYPSLKQKSPVTAETLNPLSSSQMFISNLDQQQKEPHPYTTAPDPCQQSKRFLDLFIRNQRYNQKDPRFIHSQNQKSPEKMARNLPKLGRSGPDLPRSRG
jgi:hypothetical protein